MARTSEVRLRLQAKGKEELISALKGMGKEGERAARQIERSSKKASAGLKGVNAAARSTKQSLMSFASRIPIIGDGLAAMGPAGLAAAAGIAAVSVALLAAIRIGRAAVQNFDRIAKSARDINVSTDFFQSMEQLAEEASVSWDKVSTALRTFERNAARAATGRGEMVEMLRATHPELIREIATLETAEERVDAWRRALQAATTDQERTLLATAAFGESGATVARMLIEQEESMADLIARTREMGLVVDESVLARSEEMETRLSVAERVIRINLQQAFVDLAPVMVAAAEFMGDVAKAIKGVTSEVDGLLASWKEVGELALPELEQQAERLRGDLLASGLNPYDLGEARSAATTRAAEDMIDRLEAVEARIARFRSEGEGSSFSGNPAELERQAELLAIVTAAREAAITPAQALAAEIEALNEAYEKGLIATEVERDALIASARSRTVDTAAVNARNRAESEAAQIRAELGDISGLMAIKQARLNELVRLGALDMETAAQTLERYREGLLANTEAAREAAAVTQSVITPAEAYGAQIERLNVLLEAGEISQTVHARAVDAARRAYEEADPVLQTAARVREELRTNAERFREEQERVNAAVAAGELTDGQAAVYMERYRESLERAGDAARELTLEQEILDRVLRGNVHTYEDLGDVAITVLAEIIRRQVQLADTTKGFGAFLSEILRGTAGAIGIGRGGQGAAGDGSPTFHGGTGQINRSSVTAAYRAQRPRDPREHQVTVINGERILSGPDNAQMLAMLDRALSQPNTPMIVSGGGARVEIIDQRGQSEGLELSRSQGQGGEDLLRLTITDMIRGGILAGKFDRELGSRFGLRSNLVNR